MHHGMRPGNGGRTVNRINRLLRTAVRRGNRQLRNRGIAVARTWGKQPPKKAGG